MELSYPLMRVPFEGATKSFRLYQKKMTRELALVVAQIEAMDSNDSQPPGHRMDVEAAIKELSELAQTLQRLKQSAEHNVLEQQNNLENCVKRAQYLETLQDIKIGGKISMVARQNDLGSIMNDRLVADYLLGQGYLESAKIIADSHGNMDYLLDYDLHATCQAVLKDLRDFHTQTALAWCSQNGTRLRRLQSTLEFHLRLQDFVEYVRSRKPLKAVQYARAYLAPLAIQSDNQDLRDAAIGEVQIAMAILAFESPEKCGIEAYEKIFATDRWLILEKMFCKTFNDVYGIHDPPSLCIALHAGISTLNTRACHLIRDAKLKARRPQSGFQSKRRRRKSEGDDNSDGNENNCGNKSGDELLEASTALQSKSAASARYSHAVSRSRKRKHVRTESPVSICPACSEVGSQLCKGLPFAYHPHSRLVCRVTQSLMDEHNPPLVLPNGRVYSKQGIELLTEQSTDGMIKCMDTHDVFALSDVKPVYIL
ncbi:unnamed protein product [Peronospora belbahrii]|uniref:Macrophage erythroblast attacher n=1 Tax=Peronospora belbahrii TaxID=622444 RepID=A0ABN8CZG8_9STRA|nr:unnamed protein product [Peronospora belbahrii]